MGSLQSERGVVVVAVSDQNGWWFNTTPANRPYVISYNHSNPRQYKASDPPWWTWQSGSLWVNDIGMCILFVNNTDKDLKMSSVSLKAVSCNSGNQYFVGYKQNWGYYRLGLWASGAAANFNCYYRVCNNNKTIHYESADTTHILNTLNGASNQWEQSNIFTQSITAVNSSNMDTPGSVSGRQTATFGERSGYPDNAQFKLRTYTFTECPIIEANGGFCTLHVDVSFPNYDGEYINPPGPMPFVRVLLDPNEMEIIFNEERGPYIWRMTNGKWILKRPLQVYTGTAWSDIENQGGGNN